tara:strand:- start:507 stop:866 length:360 start_codon:yes stop_codon:yes gene_type:complete
VKVRGKLKKIFISLALTMFLTSCAETVALLGPATSVAGSGNIMRSSITSAIDYGIKKSTGKSSFQHALNYAEKHNPDRKKVKCVNFLEVTETEVCSILQKRVAELKKKINKSSKIKTLD